MTTISHHESDRLKELYRYQILDTMPEEEFDHLLRMAAQICECGIAAISFVDRERQWFKSEIGLGMNETSREVAFCSYTIEQDQVMEVPNALEDERFIKNSLVTGDPRIRYYAGAPIYTECGQKIGSICVIDQKPKQLSAEKLQMLQVVSQQISKLLELRLHNQSIREKAEAQSIMEGMMMQHTLRHFDEQRFAIGTELHEKIAQDLAATNFYLDMAAATPTGPQLEILNKTRKQIHTVISSLRTLTHSIVPTTLKEGNLKDQLQFKIDQLKGMGIVLQLKFKGKEIMELEAALTLYRIVEHHLSNVFEHSTASRITIKVDSGAALQVEVKSDQCPPSNSIFTPNAHLAQIKARAHYFKGIVGLWSMPGDLCKFSVRFP